MKVVVFGGSGFIGSHVADALQDRGHEVTIFLLGDATGLIRDSVIETVVGVGPGALKDHFKAVREAKVTIFL